MKSKVQPSGFGEGNGERSKWLGRVAGCTESTEKGEIRAETAWWCTRCCWDDICFARSAADGWIRESFSAEVQKRVVIERNSRFVEAVSRSARNELAKKIFMLV